MRENLPTTRSSDLSGKITNIFGLQPLKGEVDVTTILFRITIVSFFATFSLLFLIIALTLALSPQRLEIAKLSQNPVESNVLGATTSNNSLFGNLVKWVLKPVGKAP